MSPQIIRQLYYACLRSFRQLDAPSALTESFTEYALRLSHWGSALFLGELNLDDILSDAKGHVPLRKLVIGTLADIAVTLSK